MTTLRDNLEYLAVHTLEMLLTFAIVMLLWAVGEGERDAFGE